MLQLSYHITWISNPDSWMRLIRFIHAIWEKLRNMKLIRNLNWSYKCTSHDYRITFRKKRLLAARIAELIWRVFTVKIGVLAMVEKQSICPLSAAKYQDQWNTRQPGEVKGKQLNHWTYFLLWKYLKHSVQWCRFV